MKKSLIVTILALTLFVGIFSAPAMAYAKVDCNQNYNAVVNSFSTGKGYKVVSLSRDNMAGMLLKLNNWYANFYNNKLDQQEPAQPTPAPQPEPEQPAPAPQPKPEQPAPQPKPEQPAPQPKPEPAPAPQGIGSQQSQMLEKVNQERVNAGVKALKWDANLASVAQVKAKDMVDNSYFDHNSPTYGSPFEMMKKYGITYKAAGENLAGSSSVERAHTGLMNSDGHRKNILNPNFTHMGIGVEKSAKYGYVYVQMFIGK